MKKILFYCMMPHPERGFNGAEIGSLVTYELLKDQFDITIQDVGTDDFNPFEKGWTHIKYNFKIFFHYLSKYNKLRINLKANKYDIFYFVAASSTKGHLRDVFTVMLARQYVNTIIAHNRNGNFAEIYKRKWHRKVTRFFVNSVDKFIFLSDNLANEAKAFLPKHKICVAYNPIDKEIICSEAEILQKINSKKNKRLELSICYISNMIESKGYNDVAKACLVLKERGFNTFKLNFIGRWNNSKDEKRLEEFILCNNLEEHINCIGKITNRKSLKEMLLNADIFVLPTYYPQEAQPRSIIEALNAATPIITTNHASIPEMVTDKEQAIFVDKQSPSQIADAILQLNKLNVWLEYAQKSRTRFEEKFSYGAVINQLLKAFS